MNQFLHLVETLENHIDQIREELGADWPEFAAKVQHLAPVFEKVEDETALARVVGDLYMACRERESVMTILRQTADTSDVGSDRLPPAGGTDQSGEMLIREVVNHFQSLLTRLEEIEPPEQSREDVEQ
jgi:hypothetical protein